MCCVCEGVCVREGSIRKYFIKDLKGHMTNIYSAIMTNFCQYVCRLLEVVAPSLLRPGKEVFYQPHSDVVAHLLQLLVDLVIFLVVSHQLGH